MENPAVNQDLAKEYAVIASKPAGQRVDAETLGIVRNRLVLKMEDWLTDPLTPDVNQRAEDDLEQVRTGGKIHQGIWTTDLLAGIFDDYRLTHDERELVRNDIFEIEKKE